MILFLFGLRAAQQCIIAAPSRSAPASRGEESSEGINNTLKNIVLSMATVQFDGEDWDP